MITTFDNENPIFALDINKETEESINVLCCSMKNDKNNFIEYVKFSTPINESQDSILADAQQEMYSKMATSSSLFKQKVEFPITCVKTIKANSDKNLFGTTSDKFMLWNINDTEETCKINLESTFIVNPYDCPLTSFDVSESNIIISSTNCLITILDLPTLSVKTRVLVHNQPVYDCKFVNENELISCGFDGSARELDIRDISSLTMIYQGPNPIMRCRVCPTNPNLIGLLANESENVVIVDRRNTDLPLCSTSNGGSIVTDFHFSQYDESIYLSNDKGKLMSADLTTTSYHVFPFTISPTSYPIESMAVSKMQIAFSSNNQVSVLKI